MRRVASFALLFLSVGIMSANAEPRNPVNHVGHIDPDGPLAKLMLGKEDGLVTPSIVGGDPAGPGQFPFVALTLTRDLLLTTGAVIAPGWILAAAGGFVPENILGTGTATIGTNELTIDPLTGTREVTAFTPIINEDYNSTTDKNDIGVAILGAFSKYPPLRIQTPELSTLTEAGKPLTVVGWGSMEEGGTLSPYLQYGDMKVEPNSVCADRYPNYSGDDQICQNTRKVGQCDGNVGGPSLAMNPANGWWYMVGIFPYGGVCGVDPTVSARPGAYWDWIRETTDLSLKYYDITLSNGDFIRATDASPTTGYLYPGYATPASASRTPKTQFNKSVDSWSVSTTLPAGATTLISQANAQGLDIALYGIFPATYDRVLDSLHYAAEQCKTAKNGRSIKCFDATSTVTVDLRGTSAKLTVKAQKRDILMKGATALKAYLWLKNGDNYLIYGDNDCKASAGGKVGLKC